MCRNKFRVMSAQGRNSPLYYNKNYATISYPQLGGGVIIEVAAKASKYITDLVWRFFVADMILTDQLSVLAIIPTP